MAARFLSRRSTSTLKSLANTPAAIPAVAATAGTTVPSNGRPSRAHAESFFSRGVSTSTRPISSSGCSSSSGNSGTNTAINTCASSISSIDISSSSSGGGSSGTSVHPDCFSHHEFPSSPMDALPLAPPPLIPSATRIPRAASPANRPLSGISAAFRSQPPTAYLPSLAPSVLSPSSPSPSYASASASSPSPAQSAAIRPPSIPRSAHSPRPSPSPSAPRAPIPVPSAFSPSHRRPFHSASSHLSTSPRNALPAFSSAVTAAGSTASGGSPAAGSGGGGGSSGSPPAASSGGGSARGFASSASWWGGGQGEEEEGMALAGDDDHDPTVAAAAASADSAKYAREQAPAWLPLVPGAGYWYPPVDPVTGKPRWEGKARRGSEMWMASMALQGERLPLDEHVEMQAVRLLWQLSVGDGRVDGKSNLERTLALVAPAGHPDLLYSSALRQQVGEGKEKGRGREWKGKGRGGVEGKRGARWAPGNFVLECAGERGGGERRGRGRMEGEGGKGRDGGMGGMVCAFGGPGWAVCAWGEKEGKGGREEVLGGCESV
ncbi:unnamed protein product [Closterium sp. NIES-53]